MSEEESIETGNYLRGKLSSSEIEAFENKMHSDEHFAKEVNLEKKIMQAITDNGITNLERSLQSIRNEAVENDNRPEQLAVFPTRFYLIAAVVSLLLVAFSTLYYFAQSELSNQELFANYYVPYEVESLRTADTSLQTSLDLYRNQKYSDALKLFEVDLEVNPSQIRLRFLVGHCYLNLDDFNNAIGAFETVIDHQNNIYILDAKWFLALTHLKNDDSQKAQGLLIGIMSDNGKYYEEASQLLEKL